tara:strand:+ start:83 stop:601 length:519 start_codon:yes stop_codon:yes gene_type:complete
MNVNCIIIDDFLENPDAVRDSIINSNISFDIKGNFPGSRTDIVDENYQKMFLNKLYKVLPFDIEINYGTNSFSFQLCLEDDETWEHFDEWEWTGVLYLTPNPNPDSGTVIIDPNTFVHDSDDYTVTTLVSNVYNRLVLFRGGHFPHRSNLAGFGDNIKNGRLTQVIFFKEVE